jgi:hypothetical protein
MNRDLFPNQREIRKPSPVYKIKPAMSRLEIIHAALSIAAN